MSELRKCPFCGGEATQRDIEKPFLNGWIGCSKCHCFIDWVKRGKAKAVDAWNRRTPDMGITPTEVKGVEIDPVKPIEIEGDENNPLTLEELRGMDGEPVYIISGIHLPVENDSFWAIAKLFEERKFVYVSAPNISRSYDYEDYGKTWNAYRRKPEAKEE